MHKLNEIYFQTKSFEQQRALIHEFLNQGELAAHCSFIGLKDADFISQRISNEKCLFSETVSPKTTVKYFWTKKVIRMQFLFNLVQPYQPLPLLLAKGDTYLLRH